MKLARTAVVSRIGRDVRRSVLVVSGLVLIFAALSLQMMGAEAANPPPEFSDVVVADEIFAPVSLGMAPDGRLFVLTDAGIALVIKDDQRLATPVFDIKHKVDDVSDRGLLSMTFDNNFAVNGFIYVVYTFDTNGVDDGVGRNRLVRFTVSGDTASNEVLLFDDFPDADAVFHYGGAVEMGTDGKLYVTVGDYLIGANGQDRTNIKGTVLRLNADGSIPTDNPFYDELTGTNRAIYAYGLRNPWQTAQHPVTGEIFISDVGSNSFEELNVLQEGANYGWFLAEGPKDPNDPTQSSFVDPLWAYRHADDFPNDPFVGCAIIGGSFYETPNPTFPAQYRGPYFTGDYCQGTISTVDPATGQATAFMDGFNFGLVDMAVSPVNGDLYYIDQTFNDDHAFPAGGVGKITYVGQQTDITITTQPSDVSIAVGGTASFFVGASAPGDVTYQWLRDGGVINGETGPRLTIPNVSAGDDFAEFIVEISNRQQTIQSDPAVLRITNNTVPVPAITFGGADGGYRAGTPITFSGSATDAEDGTIPGADLSWAIRLNHDDHDHALINNFIGADGSFTVPRAMESSTNVWVMLYLTATDSEGTSTTITQRVDPKIVTLTLASNPDGLQVQLDGSNQTGLNRSKQHRPVGASLDVHRGLLPVFANRGPCVDAH
jgi:glucose/arabinose dehydrogenase